MACRSLGKRLAHFHSPGERREITHSVNRLQAFDSFFQQRVAYQLPDNDVVHRPLGLRRPPIPPLVSIENVEEQEVYSAIGEEGFRKLVAAFYRQVPNDDILGPMYRGRDLAAAEERLRGFLIFRFGGPEHYIERRGHPRLRMRHAPFEINQAARDRWLQLMTSALDSTDIPPEPKEILRNFFDSTASFLINRLAQTTGNLIS